MTVSQQPICWQQPIWQMQQLATPVIKNNTHTLESLHIFLESNYKEFGLKRLAEYRVQHLFVGHQEFQ